MSTSISDPALINLTSLMSTSILDPTDPLFGFSTTCDHHDADMLSNYSPPLGSKSTTKICAIVTEEEEEEEEERHTILKIQREKETHSFSFFIKKIFL
jgi:hypothetical protein